MKISLENFQSHSRTEIELAPKGNLTVVTGASDSGKTAIIRALKWLYFNQPTGDAFVQVGCAYSRVTLELDNGWKVVRHRTKSGSRNQYITESPEGVQEAFEGFGASVVPLEVQKILGIRPLTIGDVDFQLNIAEQLSAPFLGSSISAPARAKVLGHLAGTAEIDMAAKLLGTDIYRGNQEEKGLSSKLETLTQQIEGYAWVPGFGERIAKLEEMVTKVKEAQERLKQLVGVRDRLIEVNGRITKGYEFMARFQGLYLAEGSLVGAETNHILFTTLDRLHRRYHSLDGSLINARMTLQSYLTLHKATSLLAQAEQQSSLLSDQRTRLVQHKIAQAKLNLVTKHIDEQSLGLKRLAGVGVADALVTRLAAQQTRKQQLGSLRQRFLDARHQADQARDTHARLALVDSAASKVSALTGYQDKLLALRRAKAGLEGVRQAEQATRGNLELADATLKRAQEMYLQTLQELGKCPTCGATTDKFELKEVI